LLEVEVLEAPQVRYTQDNQTPVAEMAVRFDGLRPEDPPGQIKVVGWGNLAQDLQNRAQAGQRLVVEGRLRISTVSRADGVKEKRAELTLARLHPLGDATNQPAAASTAGMAATAAAARRGRPEGPRYTSSAAAAAAAGGGGGGGGGGAGADVVVTLEEKRAGRVGRVETELERRVRVAAVKKVPCCTSK